MLWHHTRSMAQSATLNIKVNCQRSPELLVEVCHGMVLLLRIPFYGLPKVPDLARQRRMDPDPNGDYDTMQHETIRCDVV